MRKNFLKKLAIVMSFCILSMGITSNLYADAVSSNKYASSQGYDYHFFSTVGTSSGAPWALTNLKCDTGSTPQGYMGVYARLYGENGDLKSSSDWYYNSMKETGVGVYTYGTGSGNFYSHGKVKIYNGNGYNVYDTYKSPCVYGVKAVGFNDYSPYQINDRGQTYGSGLKEMFLGVEPDLIEACGVNGTVGYVRSKDLELKNCNTLEEVLKQKYTHIRRIPLYEKDGTTIKGEFEIKTEIVKGLK